MKKAFTIIELIVVIVILGIVAGLGIEIIKFSYDNEQRVRILNELELKSQVTMDFLTTHLNNAIKNSYRLKKQENSECANSITDCKFVFNLNKTSLKDSDFKIFEWARIAIIDKKHNKWDGLNETKRVVNEALDPTKKCYETLGSTTYFKCFSITSNNIKLTTNQKIIETYDSGTRLGIYFLGDNIATSTSFMEKDLYDLDILTPPGSDKETRITLRLDEKNFTMSNVYVLVDKIEGIIYDDTENKLKYYSYDYKDKTANFTTNAKPKVTLVNHVSDFSISSNNGVTTLRLCLEAKDLPGSFINKKTTIKVCKTGVIL